MKKQYKYFFTIVFTWILSFASVVIAAPTTTTLGTILPETDLTYDLGSSSLRWANIYGDNFNASGLNVSGSLGSELVVNGDFTTDLTGWGGTNWVYSVGKAFHTSGVSEALNQTATIATIGTTYKVVYTVSGRTAGQVRIHFGGVFGEAVIGNGTYTDYITANRASYLYLKPSSTFDGAVDNVSIKALSPIGEVTIDSETDFRKKITVFDKISFPDGHSLGIGFEALSKIATGTYSGPAYNTGVGYQAGKNTNIGQVTAFGFQSALNFTGEGSVTAFGVKSGVSLGANSYVTLVGNYAGASVTSGRQSCFGDEACGEAITNEVSAFGGYACWNNSTGNCDAFGLDSQRYGATGLSNSSFGRESLLNVTGNYSSAFGVESGRSLLGGRFTGQGFQAGRSLTTGDGIFIGYRAGYGATPANAPVTDTRGILIGDNSNRSVVSATSLDNYIGIGDGVLIDKSNQVKIGNPAITETILYGNVGIGSTTPSGALHVSTSGTDNNFFQDSFGGQNNIIGRRAGGTTNTPTNILKNNTMLQLSGRGYDGTSMGSGSKAYAQFNASQDWSATANGTYIRFFTTPNDTTTATERLRIDNSGNLKLAGSATRIATEGTNHLDIFDGIAPAGTLANGVSLYSTEGELRVMDSAGNATLLSPHENINNHWVFDSKNDDTGKNLVIDMELIMKKLNETFGWDYVHETINGVKSPSPKRTGITLYDEVTGDPYCLSIANGTQKTISGECKIREKTSL